MYTVAELIAHLQNYHDQEQVLAGGKPIIGIAADYKNYGVIQILTGPPITGPPTTEG